MADVYEYYGDVSGIAFNVGDDYALVKSNGTIEDCSVFICEDTRIFTGYTHRYYLEENERWVYVGTWEDGRFTAWTGRARYVRDDGDILLPGCSIAMTLSDG